MPVPGGTGVRLPGGVLSSPGGAPPGGTLPSWRVCLPPGCNGDSGLCWGCLPWEGLLCREVPSRSAGSGASLEQEGHPRGNEVREAKPSHALTGRCAGTRPHAVDHPRTQPPPYLPWRVLALPGGGCAGPRATRPPRHGAPGAGGLRIVARGSTSSTSLPPGGGCGHAKRAARRALPLRPLQGMGVPHIFRAAARRSPCGPGLLDRGLSSPACGPVTGVTGT